MEYIHASLSVSITELKKNPTTLLRNAEGETIVILNHNRPVAYLVPVDVYERMLDIIEDLEQNSQRNPAHSWAG